jgi:hypothetical protein
MRLNGTQSTYTHAWKGRFSDELLVLTLHDFREKGCCVHFLGVDSLNKF